MASGRLSLKKETGISSSLIQAAVEELGELGPGTSATLAGLSPPAAPEQAPVPQLAEPGHQGAAQLQEQPLQPSGKKRKGPELDSPAAGRGSRRAAAKAVPKYAAGKGGADSDSDGWDSDSSPEKAASDYKATDEEVPSESESDSDYAVDESDEEDYAPKAKRGKKAAPAAKAAGKKSATAAAKKPAAATAKKSGAAKPQLAAKKSAAAGPKKGAGGKSGAVKKAAAAAVSSPADELEPAAAAEPNAQEEEEQVSAPSAAAAKPSAVTKTASAAPARAAPAAKPLPQKPFVPLMTKPAGAFKSPLMAGGAVQQQQQQPLKKPLAPAQQAQAAVPVLAGGRHKPINLPQGPAYRVPGLRRVHK